MDTESYDSSPTIFSPDGRLYQVEYSREAVKRGSPVLGIVYDRGVIIATARMKGSHLLEEIPGLKINQISETLAIGASGLMADNRSIVDHAREVEAEHTMTYSESASVEDMSHEIGSLMQYYTQFSGYRPMGLALIIAGIDGPGPGGPCLYEIDPSGAAIPYWATAIGQGRGDILDRLNTFYERDMSRDDALKLAIRALNEAVPILDSWKKVTMECVDMNQDEGYRELDIIGDHDPAEWKD